MNRNFTSMAWVPCFRILNSMLTPRVKPLYRFCLFVMRSSNCSAPIPPGQPRGQKKNMCDNKGRGTRK